MLLGKAAQGRRNFILRYIQAASTAAITVDDRATAAGLLKETFRTEAWTNIMLRPKRLRRSESKGALGDPRTVFGSGWRPFLSASPPTVHAFSKSRFSRVSRSTASLA